MFGRDGTLVDLSNIDAAVEFTPQAVHECGAIPQAILEGIQIVLEIAGKSIFTKSLLFIYRHIYHHLHDIGIPIWCQDEQYIAVWRWNALLSTNSSFEKKRLAISKNNGTITNHYRNLGNKIKLTRLRQWHIMMIE